MHQAGVLNGSFTITFVHHYGNTDCAIVRGGSGCPLRIEYGILNLNLRRKIVLNGIFTLIRISLRVVNEITNDGKVIVQKYETDVLGTKADP